MQTQDIIKLLDELLTNLSTSQTVQPIAAQPKPLQSGSAAATPLADAIDREIGGAARQTSITDLRDSDAVERFRQELETESLTLTTVTSLLQLVRQALQTFGLLAA